MSEFIKFIMRWFFQAAFLIAICSKATALEKSDTVQVIPLLKTQTSWDGETISYPKGKAEITAIRVEIAPGARTGWHWHNVPSFAVMLDGELQVKLKNGKQKTIRAGDVLVEVVGSLHNGQNIGKTPVKLIVFYAGAVGAANTVKWGK